MPIQSMTYDVGQTLFKQPLTLTWTRSSSGRPMWVLHREAADQRDDTDTIYGLTDDVILAMAEAVRQNRAPRAMGV